MKKILFVIDTLRMGGAEKSLVTLLKAIDKNKYDIDLLVFEEGGVLEAEVPSGINIIYVDDITRAMTLEFRKYARDLLRKGYIMACLQRILLSIEAKKGEKKRFGWNKIKRYIPKHQKKYDIAISYLEGAPAFYVLDKVNAKKKIGWIHIDMTGRIVSDEERLYYSRFDYLATISDVCKNAFVQLFPETEKKISIIENIVLEDDVKQKAEEKADLSNWSSDCINLVTVGRLDVQKGIDIGIRACKVLREKGIPVCWHVYGKGSQQKYLEELIEENHLEDIFILEGMKTNPYPYMKKADIIVQPSRFEGKSIVLDEAKILGKAIVVTRYPSVTDQIVDGETGVIVDINPEAIAEGIERIINNSELKHTMEIACQKAESRRDKVLKELYAIIDC